MASEARLSRWEAVAAHSQVVVLLDRVCSQVSGDIRLPVELALGTIGLEVERLACSGTGGPGIETRLCAPGQRCTGPRSTPGGEIRGELGPVSAFVDTRNGIDCGVDEGGSAAFPAISVVGTSCGDGAEVGRPRVPAHDVAAGGTFWDAGDEPVQGLSVVMSVVDRPRVCEGSGKERARAAGS